MLGSSSLRLAAIYTAVFSIAVAVLGLVTIQSTRAVLVQQFETRIRAEMGGLEEDFRGGGAAGVVDEIEEHHDGAGDLAYGLEAGGRPVAGRLAGLHPPTGWSTASPGGKGPRLVRMLTVALPGGYRLSVGDDWSRIGVLDRSVARNFALAFAGLLVLGVGVGFAFSRAIHRRLAAISGAAEAIIDGDLTRRIPVPDPARGGDDLARLSHTINRMLDRIGALMDSLRQASNDVAHDLRTPLTRLRQRLEFSAARAADPVHRGEIAGALEDVDSILATFSALLRIAEIDVGARRTAFEPFDLADLARMVAADFAPAAEDAGQVLAFEAEGPAVIPGDSHLVTQAVVNLVENAMRHTPRGSRIQVSVAAGADAAVLTVADNGPGVPEAERHRVFDRFYRLERSRSTSGSGLGLALVAAVARLHRGDVRLSDAGPGLKAQMDFPWTV